MKDKFRSRHTPPALPHTVLLECLTPEERNIAGVANSTFTGIVMSLQDPLLLLVVSNAFKTWLR